MKTFSLAVAGALVSILAVGCSSAPDDPAAPNDEADATEDELRQGTCANPSRYFATRSRRAGACSVIAGDGGSWIPEALFSNAPAEVQASTCVYRWSGPKSPDQNAIAAVRDYGSAFVPVCSPGAAPKEGTVKKIPMFFHKNVGSVGCDVCGVIRKDKLWVVLPPYLGGNQFSVPLSNGTEQAFQLSNPSASQALTITLPSPPAGTHYVDGRVSLE